MGLLHTTTPTPAASASLGTQAMKTLLPEMWPHRSALGWSGRDPGRTGAVRMEHPF